jgi:predicted TIM-barrel fold metal-dependent hydrolase
MPLDAHAHFFAPGYVDLLPESCRRVQPDEFTLYSALAARHAITQVLAIGYEGEPWATGNNAYLATLARQTPWVHPVAYAEPATLQIGDLEGWYSQGFVGISLYLMNASRADLLSAVPSDVWSWLDARNWLVSVNSHGDLWRAWPPVLDSHPGLRLLISHLGLPPRRARAPSLADAANALAVVTRLAVYPGVHVKLSGLYALTDPGHAYPHHAAWPYIEVIAQRFGVGRLLWGSDFSPALEQISFAQARDVIDCIPWFSDSERAAILGGTLAHLLQSVTAKEASA